MQTNILIYPKFKKIDKTKIETSQDIDSVANHYTIQFMKAMENHGVKADPKYFSDLAFFREIIKAILMRTEGTHHSIQDWIDDAYIPEMAGMEDVVIFDDSVDDGDQE